MAARKRCFLAVRAQFQDWVVCGSLVSVLGRLEGGQARARGHAGMARATSCGNSLARKSLLCTNIGLPVSAVLLAALACVLPVKAGPGIAL